MQDLDAHLLNFEEAISARLPYHLSASRIARAIRDIYATRSASAVLSCVRKAFSDAVEFPCTRNDQPSLWPVLPTAGDIKEAAPRLVEAVNSRNRHEAIEALAKMGILTLCPSSNHEFSRLELSVRSIVGRVRLIPLVELAMLAAELDFYDKANDYVAEAQTLSPGPEQLHHLHVVAGVVALSRGDLAQATEYLSKSVRVCRKDGFACLACSIREQNLMLAGKLLDYGQDAIVLSYLAECLGVWKYDENRISSWINTIRAGTRPEFSGFRLFRRPKEKMMHQILWGSLFTETPIEEFDRGTIEEFRGHLRDEYRRAVKGKLGTSKN